MKDLKDEYGVRAEDKTTEYPFGSIKNAISPGTGTPYKKEWQNDWLAFFQRLMVEAEMTPDGNTDTVVSSQLYDAFRSVASQGSVGYNWAKVGGGNLTALYFAEGDGTVLAVEMGDRGTEKMATSTNDGHTWAAYSPAELAFKYAMSVTYGGGLFVLIVSTATDYTGPSELWTSADAVTWTEQTIPAGTYKDVAYDGTNFIIVGESGVTATSPDAATWTDRTATTTQDWNGLAVGTGIVVAVADGGTGSRTMRSTDSGLTWTAIGSGDDTKEWISIAYGKGVFSALSNTGDCTYSIDLGLTWVIGTIPGSSSFTSVVYVSGKFVGLASLETGNDQIIVSDSGSDWALAQSGSTEFASKLFTLSTGRLLTWSGSLAYLSGV